MGQQAVYIQTERKRNSDSYMYGDLDDDGKITSADSRLF